MPGQRLISAYLDDVASHSTVADQFSVRRYWLRAVIETLKERSITTLELPRRRRKTTTDVVVERYLPVWRQIPDDDLYAFLDHVRSFWSRRPGTDLS